MKRFFIFVCDGIIFGALFLVGYAGVIVLANSNDRPKSGYYDRIVLAVQAAMDANDSP